MVRISRLFRLTRISCEQLWNSSHMAIPLLDDAAVLVGAKAFVTFPLDGPAAEGNDVRWD